MPTGINDGGVAAILNLAISRGRASTNHTFFAGEPVQLQLTRSQTSKSVVAKVVLKLNFPSYLIIMAGIHGGKRTND